MAKIFAHELLDRQQPSDLFVPIERRQPHLLGPFQDVVGFVGVKVHFVAQMQQKIAGGANRELVFLRDRALQLQCVRSVSPWPAKPSQRSNCRSRSPPRERLMLGSSR